MSENNKKNPRSGKIAVGIFALLMASAIGAGVYSFANPGEYIEGNVLNIPYINNWYEEDGLDSPWYNASFYSGIMYRNLFLADSTFQTVQVDLASTYTVSEDGLEYAITLKDGLQWSDGEDLTVDDVAFSIETALQAERVNAIYSTAFGEIEGVEAFLATPEDGLSGLSVSGNTLTMTLCEPYPAMLQVLAQFAILPEHCFENVAPEEIHLTASYWQNPVVSGMYRVGEVDGEAQTIRLVRNEYYSGEEPNIDEVLIHINYKFANLDYYSTNNITEMINYRSMRDMTEHKVDILFYRYFVFNIQGDDGNENSTMEDATVRKAISLAIDRETLLYEIYLDSGYLIESGVPSSNDAYDGEVNAYDPEQAKALLAASDYDLDRPLRLAYYYTDSVSEAFMEAVAKNLEAVGFTVEVVQFSSATELYEEREYDLMLKGLSAFDISEWYIEYSSSSVAMAKLFGGETAFEDLVVELTHTTDEEEHDQLLAELQALERELVYKIPLFTLGQVAYINEERVQLPSGITFGNSWYKYDMDFENWSIKKD